MPTQIIRYACNICEEEYDAEGEAQECEDFGRPVRMKPGFIFSLAVFELAEAEAQSVRLQTTETHVDDDWLDLPPEARTQ